MKKIMIVALLIVIASMIGAQTVKPGSPSAYPEIVTYVVAGGDTPADLQRSVFSLIQEGYQPWGSPILAKGYYSHDAPFTYLQAMVKYKK